MPKYNWSIDRENLQTKGKLTRCLWGWPAESLLDYQMNHLELSSEERQFLHAIDISPMDRSLGDLELSWDLARIASIARGFQRKHDLELTLG